MAISIELKQARRDHILDTARQLIGRRDVSGFSMAELARPPSRAWLLGLTKRESI